MIEYIEALELRNDDKSIEIIREKFDDTEAKIMQKIKDKENTKKSYKYRKHKCYHDEEKNKPCIVEEINGYN